MRLGLQTEELEVKLVSKGDTTHFEEEVLPPDDLTEATEDLNDALMANYLKVRYGEDKIYTYIGDILIALNPFKRMPLYDPSQSRLYIQAESKHTLDPHIFYIANNAFKSMLVGGTPQVLRVCGDRFLALATLFPGRHHTLASMCYTKSR